MVVNMKNKMLRYIIIVASIVFLMGCTANTSDQRSGKGNESGKATSNLEDSTKNMSSEAGISTDKDTNEVTVSTLLRDKGISFSELASFYSEDIKVEILSSKPASIYYTVDGSEPDRETNLYREGIGLMAGSQVDATCIKAKAFYEDGSESETIVHTYFTGKGVESRYDTLVFSITTEPYNLYDYEYGIFVEGKLRDDYIKANPRVEVNPDAPANYNMRGREAEREVYLEVLDPDGNMLIEQLAGIRTYGGWSRAREQKSVKLFARKDYSETDNKFRYEFFPNKLSADDSGEALDSFKQLVLRNCGNDNGFGFLRDELFQTLAGHAGYPDYEAVRPSAMYVNGDYRGFFWLHEVYGDEYFEDHYGKYNGAFEILEGGELFKKVDDDEKNSYAVKDYEEAYAFAYQDITDDTVFQALSELVDIDNYLSYYALQAYINNEDWPHNNYRVYRYYASDGEQYAQAPFDGKWRYLLHDLDFSFGIYGMGPTTNSIQNYVGPRGEIKEAAPLFGQLMKRRDCREMFITKTLDLLNGSFSSKHLSKVLDEMHKDRLNELKNTYNKGLLEDWVTYDQLDGRIKDIKTYGRARAIFILVNYQRHFGLGDIYQLHVKPEDGIQIRINTYVTDIDFEGSYYSDYATKLTAILPEGKVLDYWLVNGEKVAAEELSITAQHVVEGKVEVSCVIR